MLNRFYEFLYLVLAYQPCTKFHLEHLERGRFREIMKECISESYIEIYDKNSDGEERYIITDEGRKIVNNPTEEK